MGAGGNGLFWSRLCSAREFEPRHPLQVSSRENRLLFSFWRKDFYYTIRMFLLRESFPLTAKRAPRFSLCNLSPLPYLVRTAEISHTTKDFGGLWGLRTEISGRYRKLDISAGKMKRHRLPCNPLFAGSQGRSKLLVYGSFGRPHHTCQGLGCCKRGLT